MDSRTYKKRKIRTQMLGRGAGGSQEVMEGRARGPLQTGDTGRPAAPRAKEEQGRAFPGFPPRGCRHTEPHRVVK